MADMTVYFKQVGARVREIRLQKGMSQLDLAAKSNISLPHISDIELGKKGMHLSTFIRLTEALEVSADVLLRSNVPQVTEIYKSEFAEILNDCTPAEMETILRIVKELKLSLHQKKTEDVI
ncbi:MAG: helix-turn-helix domain-containing protein [Faecousia sp.]